MTSATGRVRGLTFIDDAFNCRRITVKNPLDLDAPRDSFFDLDLSGEVREATAAKIHAIFLIFSSESLALARIARDEGFVFHHATPSEIVMTCCLQKCDKCTIPKYSTLSLSATVVIFDSTLTKIAAVREKYGPSLGWKPITTILDYENKRPEEAASLDLKEQVGIDVPDSDLKFCGRLFASKLFTTSFPDLNEIFATSIAETPLVPDPSKLLEACWIPIEAITEKEPKSVDSLAILAAKAALQREVGFIRNISCSERSSPHLTQVSGFFPPLP
jgi:hypothetical protein